MSSPSIDEMNRLVIGFVSLYNETSPISFTLVAASILEDQVLRTVQKIAPGFEKQGNHYDRVRLLSCTGTITTDVKSALESFAKIRNAFAHNPHTTSFADCKIVTLAKNLKSKLNSSNNTGNADDFWGNLTEINCKFTNVGHDARWTDEVSQTILGGYIMLSFYLMWARHRSVGPSIPYPMTEIAKP